MSVISAILRDVLKRKVERANLECRETFKEYYAKYPNRNFAISVVDDERGEKEILGFGLKDGQLISTSQIANPTLKMTVSLRVFRALLAGDLTDDQLFYEGFGIFEGDQLFKHKIILSEMIKSFKKVGLLKEAQNGVE